VSGCNAAQRSAVAAAVAAAFLDGEWERLGMADRAAPALVRRPRWLDAVAAEAVQAYRDPPRDRHRELVALIDRALARRDAEGLLPRPPRRVRTAVFAPGMGRMRWPVLPIETRTDLAQTLDLHPGELAWLADRRGLERRAGDEQLRNYRYRWLARPGGPPRMIEQPKRLLKETQRRVLRGILEAVPAHAAAHGFRRGHSAVTHARMHTGREVVLRLDLEDFFASIPAGRVYGLFRAAGYPEEVAADLTGLVTNVVPAATWAAAPAPWGAAALAAHHRLGRRLATPHLPQGAPTSPALANLCAYRLDRRLAGLAAAFDARYSRYADDLVLSGGRNLHRAAAVIRTRVAAIAREEGFAVNAAKSNLMTRAGRQRVAGIVVNEHPNLARAEYDRLKAILHDARLHGPGAANRAGHPAFREHLEGRIAWLGSLNPERGAMLRERLEPIDWG
jgi:RNA-directed DNA polymerase